MCRTLIYLSCIYAVCKLAAHLMMDFPAVKFRQLMYIFPL